MILSEELRHATELKGCGDRCSDSKGKFIYRESSDRSSTRTACGVPHEATLLEEQTDMEDKKMMTKPIIALDMPSKAEAMSFLESFEQEPLFLKVGMELYYSEGPNLIHELKEKGHQIFLDLKLHDIPNTVYRAMKVLASLEVDMVNVHAAGGKAMMEAAMRGLEEGTKKGSNRPLLIAVTQLTSTTEEAMQNEQLIGHSLEESVTQYAKLTHQAGLDGVVCSALEARMIHEATSQEFLCVTPGIRPTGADVGDQKRVATPELALKEGATHIVVGRPITQSENPVKAYKNINNQWNGEK